MAETGWHRHKGFTMVHRDDQCSFSEKQPVAIVPLDGLEETIAREVANHESIGGGISCYCMPVDEETGASQFIPESYWEAHIARHVARALAGDGAR